jgi:cytoskeletal protein CcmA (bactofilin family)
MAMFDKDDPKSSGPGTIIGSSVKLIGAIRDGNDIVVHGSVEGELGSDRSVTVGETATVKGPITGAVVMIAGTVRGSIEAGERLELLPTGKVYGNIATKDLIIRSGALFVGKSTMSSAEAKETEEIKEKEQSVELES